MRARIAAVFRLEKAAIAALLLIGCGIAAIALNAGGSDAPEGEHSDPAMSSKEREEGFGRLDLAVAEVGGRRLRFSEVLRVRPGDVVEFSCLVHGPTAPGSATQVFLRFVLPKRAGRRLKATVVARSPTAAVRPVREAGDAVEIRSPERIRLDNFRYVAKRRNLSQVEQPFLSEAFVIRDPDVRFSQKAATTIMDVFPTLDHRLTAGPEGLTAIIFLADVEPA